MKALQRLPQTSMSARAQGASVCKQVHPVGPSTTPVFHAQRGAHRHHTCMRDESCAVGAHSCRHKVSYASMPPAATQARMHPGAAHSQAGEALKRPEAARSPGAAASVLLERAGEHTTDDLPHLRLHYTWCVYESTSV